jgi:hypothetical protein
MIYYEANTHSNCIEGVPGIAGITKGDKVPMAWIGITEPARRTPIWGRQANFCMRRV